MKCVAAVLILAVAFPFSAFAGVAEYEKQGAALLASTLTSGTVRYIAVMRATYGEQTDALRAIKREYRAASTGLYFSDYECEAFEPAPVCRDETTTTMNTLVYGGMYSWTYQKVTLYGISPSYSTLFHEAGHSSQRAQEPAASSQVHEETRLADALGRAGDLRPYVPAAKDHRYGYLLSQHEIEVRMQDLNRYAYVTTGNAILTPSDTVRALLQMGIRLRIGEVVKALNEAGESVEVGEVEAMLRNVRKQDGRELRRVFRAAFDMAELFETTRDLSREMQGELLRKIVTETPAHM